MNSLELVTGRVGRSEMDRKVEWFLGIGSCFGVQCIGLGSAYLFKDMYEIMYIEMEDDGVLFEQQ